MPAQPSPHVVYKSMNRPLTIWGAERRLFLLALMLGAAVFNFFGSLLGGVVLFAVLYAAARWLTKTDLQLLRILFNSGRFRSEYDPLTFEPFFVRRHRGDET